MVAMQGGAKVVLLVVLAEAFGSSANDTAWQPWEQMKKYVLQWFHPAGHGHSQHFLHHEAAPWTKAHVAGREALGEEFEMTGESQQRRIVPKVDFNNFSLELFERDFQHQQPLVLTGLVPKWPATTEWTWEQLTDPKGKYGRFQLNKHLTFYFSTHAQNENLFLENIILQPPFSHDCPLGSVSQQGDGPKQILGRNFLPRLNKAWSEAKQDAVKEGLLEGDFAESVQGFVIAGPAGAGGMLHIDPDSTSYWNALVHGRKRWMFLTEEELSSLADLVVSKGLTQEVANLTSPKSSAQATSRHVKKLLKKLPAIVWFGKLLPLLQKADVDFARREVTVQAGELVYGPPDMWHIALALEDSICCSEQMIDEGNLLRFVQDEGQSYEPSFAYLGCQAGQKHWPELMEPLASFCQKAEKDLRREARLQHPAKKGPCSELDDSPSCAA